MKTRTRLIAIASAAIAIVFAGALPAFADHDAGVQDLDHCEYGSMLDGGPAYTLYTDNFTALRAKGSLLVVCSFAVQLHYPACDFPQSDCTDGEPAWNAPNRPKTYKVTECFAPGTDLAGQTQPNGESARRSDRGSIVFYRTHAVLTCYWKDDPTDDPGYNDPYTP